MTTPTPAITNPHEYDDLLAFVERVAEARYEDDHKALIMDARRLILPICPHCDEPADDIQTVEDRDDDTGYHAELEMCGECRRAPMRREAEEAGGLCANALELLGVDESWMYAGGGAVPARPMAAETAAQPSTEEAAL